MHAGWARSTQVAVEAEERSDGFFELGETSAVVYRVEAADPPPSIQPRAASH